MVYDREQQRILCASGIAVEMHLIQFSRKEFGQDIRVQSPFAKCATGALLTATPAQGLWVTTKERRDLTVPWQQMGRWPVQM